jgi:hypothetical protein
VKFAAPLPPTPVSRVRASYVYVLVYAALVRVPAVLAAPHGPVPVTLLGIATLSCLSWHRLCLPGSLVGCPRRLSDCRERQSRRSGCKTTVL